MEVRLKEAPLLGFQLDAVNTNRDLRLPAARAAQEQLLYGDLLRVIVGSSGSYIRRFKRARSGAAAEYGVDSSVDISLEHAIMPLLDLARHHEMARQYAGELSELSMGRINHALGGAISAFCSDLVAECAALEPDGGLGLQDLVFTLRTQSRRFEHLAALIDELRDLREIGGAVLATLSRKLEFSRGSDVAREMLETLLVQASKPMLQMLASWVRQGQIDDPFDEFFIRIGQADTLAEDWDKFYVDHSKIPFELQSPDVYNQVLLAGKYLNVSGVEPGSDDQPLDASSVLDVRLIIGINEAYAFANERLLKLLLNEELMEKLSQFKHSFFLHNSDFLPTFLATASRELHKPVAGASRQKLQYALDMAIQQPGSISSEQHLDDLRVSLASSGLIDELLAISNVSGVTAEQLEQYGDEAVQANEQQVLQRDVTALQALQLDFTIEFPMNLVISRNIILRYQFLFRLLLTLRTALDDLNDAWSHQTKSAVWRHKASPALEAVKSNCTKLRVRIIHCFQILLYYCTTSVIEENWKGFMVSLNQCKTVDSLERAHLAFLDKCLKECMLTKSHILKVLFKLFRDVRLFTLFIKSHEKTLYQIEPFELPQQHQHQPEPSQPPSELLDFMQDCVQKYDRSYSKHTQELVEMLGADQENAALRGLLTRF